MPLPTGPVGPHLAARSALSSAGTPRSFEAHALLFKQGETADSVLLIETGHVKIVYADPDGRQTVLGVRGPGDLIGEFAALTGSARTAGVVALQPVTCFAVDSTVFVRLLIRDPGTMLGVMGCIIAKVGESDRRRLDFGRMTVERRVARFLSEIANPADSGADPVTVPLSQADLATAVGATRESCAVAIRHLRGAGLVETRPRAIKVLDLERLRVLSQGESARRSVRHRG